MINDTYAELYNPPEHVTVYEIIVLFKGRDTLKQYIPKKHKHFGPPSRTVGISMPSGGQKTKDI
jgi:hypothetical protein